MEHLVDVVPECTGSSDALEPSNRSAFDSMVAELSPRQRTVMILRYQEDWSEAQIAAAMGVSPGTVKTLASRALSRLRTALPSTERTRS